MQRGTIITCVGFLDSLYSYRIFKSIAPTAFDGDFNNVACLTGLILSLYRQRCWFGPNFILRLFIRVSG